MNEIESPDIKSGEAPASLESREAPASLGSVEAPASLALTLTARHKPDILQCFANLSAYEVFTLPGVANRMLDLLPANVWTNPDLKFLDPGCKSGVFLREAAKRLMVGLEAAIPDESERRAHIFRNMLYGIAITELTAQIARRSLYYTKDASSEKSVVQMDSSDGNIVYRNIPHAYVGGSCTHCGAPESAAREENQESHAYLFIHQTLQEIFPDMKFDVIIGNPPYQLGTTKVQENGKKKANAKPIYQHFVLNAIDMNPRYVSMVIPSRWFNSDLEELRLFRSKMQSVPPIRIVDIPNENDVFPGIECKGGVCYFLTDTKRVEGNETIFDKYCSGEVLSSDIRVISDFDDILREPLQYSIVRKVLLKGEKTLSDLFSSQTPFGLHTNFNEYCHEKEDGAVVLYVSKFKGFKRHVKKSIISKNIELLDHHLVFTTKASEGKAVYPNNVIGATFHAPPNTACTQSYLVAGAFEDEISAANYAAYLKTKFARFLIDCVKNTQDLNRNCVKFVPQQDWTRPMTDEDLYRKYGLSQMEIEFIEKRIKEMA